MPHHLPPIVVTLLLLSACHPESAAFVAPSNWLRVDPERVTMASEDGLLTGRLVISNLGQVDVDVRLFSPDDPSLVAQPDSGAVAPGEFLATDLVRVDDGSFLDVDLEIRADGLYSLWVPVTR